ncbi:MAG: hypothetical protein Q7S99_03050 [Parvibaculum sp.]|nr:hypothetical protein [Parvibaculum sp.]
MPFVIFSTAAVIAVAMLFLAGRAAFRRSWARSGLYAVAFGTASIAALTAAATADKYEKASSDLDDVERAACLVSADCLVKTFEVEARTACEAAVSKRAKLEAVWKPYSERYSTIAVYDAGRSKIAMTGSGVGFKNGFGAIVPMRFACIYDAKAEKISTVSVEKAD